MPKVSRIFKRLVLGLQPSATDQVMCTAAAMAELLQVELIGLFLEDTSLRYLAALPFAREFRLVNGDWHAIDDVQLAGDIARAARVIERMFSNATKTMAIRHRFEIARGPFAAALQAISRSNDIVMIIEPVNAAERATQQFAWLIDAAFRSKAAVMIVPARVARVRGAVLVIAAGAGDASIDAAAAVARAAGEDLVIIDVGEVPINDADLQTHILATGLSVQHAAVSQSARSSSAALDYVLHQFQERLIVLTRGVFKDRRAAAIASTRNVPVLIVEPTAFSPTLAGS
jgi:hypothetical protein